MIRTLALTIALTLAAGPSAALVCQVWCDSAAGPQAVAAHSCRHPDTGAGPTLTGNDACEDLPDVTAFVREDARRNTSGSDAHAAVIVPRYRLATSISEHSALHNPHADWSFDRRPLTTALRI